MIISCALGLPAGLLLLWKIPLCNGEFPDGASALSIVIPARDEEHNLPRLLNSLTDRHNRPREIVVVDDSSTDGTAAVARAGGAKVVAGRALPAGWTGKTWACHQGADFASNEFLLFLDADTYFEPKGLEKIVAASGLREGPRIVCSILPYHVMRKPYEELSLFFNLLMAIGAGGFGLTGRARLFGQSLLIHQSMYERCGGHSGVRSFILENLALAPKVEAAGGRCVCLGGRGTLNVRMFPDGLARLCEGWTKAFADGAAASEPMVLGIATFWLATLCSTVLLLAFTNGPWREACALLYFCYALQLVWLARQVGNFRFLTCLLYPIPLFFYFGVFGQSLFRRAFKRKVSWRGRQL